MVGCFSRDTGELEAEDERRGRRWRSSGSSCFTASPGSVLMWRREAEGAAGEPGWGDTGSTFTSLGLTMSVAGKSVSISR